MDSHWAQERDWEEYSRDEDAPYDKAQGTDNLSPGSYHCKSALRSHEDNMKLYLYRTSYKRMRDVTGGDPYDDRYITVLPRIWKCFYDKRHGLDGDANRSLSRLHSTPSLAFASWSDPQLSSIVMEDLLSRVTSLEKDIFEVTSEDHGILMTSIKRFARDNSRVIYLMVFINYVLVVLNHKANESCPDITVDLPGVLFHLDSDVKRCKYNDYFDIVLTGDAVQIRMPGYNQILQKDLFLTLSDKLFERFNVMLGCTIIRGLCKDPEDPDMPLERLVVNLISYGDDLLLVMRNRGYDLLSKFEAYCVATMLTHDDDRLWNSREFLNNLIEDDATENPDLHEHALYLVNILSTASVHNLAEVHGLWRIWGHPIIDLEGGMRKMEATCLKQANVDRRETAICTRTFKLTYFMNYYNKHHHYPLSNITKQEYFDMYSDQLKNRDKVEYLANRLDAGTTSYLLSCLQEDRRIDQHSSMYDHSDWDKVLILQSFQVPRSVNVATMIKDKAISMTRSELIDSVSRRRSVFDSTKRRGILRWLSSQAERILDFLSLVDENGLSEDDRIIGLYPKEREMKTKARFFSLMSYKMRMYITATEEILGKYILKYFPMITMSDTLLSMIIRLYDMTTGIGEQDTKVTYSMNIDFSKWNQNMRERTNAGVFDSLDRILGFRKLISRTHDIFRNSYLYLCSGEYIPAIINNNLTVQSPYSRTNDESGKEGLRQKGWTITTVCDILSLAFKHKAKIELIGGGDNQVLTVTFNIGKHAAKEGRGQQLIAIRGRMESFRNALAKKMEKRGLPLKLEETWISHKLLMYNKIMYYEGVPLRGRLKVISRLFSNSNVGVTSLGGITSTLGTGYQALSAKDYSPTLSWIISRVFTYIYMTLYQSCNPITGCTSLDKQVRRSIKNIRDGRSILGSSTLNSGPTKFKKIINFETTGTLSSEELFIIVIYYHKILGGPGIGPPTSYIMKGFPDPLSEGLAFNYYIINRTEHKSLRDSIRNLTMVERSNIMHWEHLLEDPVSINHNVPSHGIAALRSSAEQVVREAQIENIEFKNLLKVGDNQYLKSLSEALCSPSELEPRILHDIVGATIPGYVNTIVSRVDQSTTINKLSSNIDVVKEIYENEIFYYAFLSRKIKYPQGHQIGTCPTSDSKKLRNWTWNKKIIGVTTPHPFAYLTPVCHTSNSPDCDQNYIMVYTTRDVPIWAIRRGQFRPYFGSYTEEKFKMTTLTAAYGDESVLRRAIKIQKLLGWRFQEGTTLYNLIQKILSCVTDADPNKFLPIKEEITGDVEHRYHDMATKHGGIPTNLIQPYTTTSCNTSTFINHSKGALNESLHFQAAIIYCSMKSILMHRDRAQISEVIHFHETCRECIMKVEKPEGDDDVPVGVSLLSCPTNTLMYVHEEDIPVHYHSMREFYRDQERKQQGELTLSEQDDKPDRGSWLILIATMLISNGKMKRSAFRLLMESLDVSEIILIIYFIQLYHSTSVTKMPPSKYTVLTIRSMVEEWGEPLRQLVLSKKISQYFNDTGDVLSSGSDDNNITASIKILGERAEELLETIQQYFWQQQSVKYQEPHRKMGMAILSQLINRSMRSCDYCHSIICGRISEGGVRVLCHLHGEIILSIKFHLFSLDKLSKEKSNLPITSPEGRGPRCLPERKRTGMISSLMDRAKRAKLANQTTFIRGTVFYDTSSFLTHIGDKLPEWEKYSISTTNTLHPRAIDNTDIITITCNRDWVDETTSKYIMSALCIYQSILMISSHKKRRRDSTKRSAHMDIILITEIKYHSALLLTRILILVNGLCSITRGIQNKIKITLVPSNTSDIEEVDFNIISGIKTDVAEGTLQNPLITVGDQGDGCLKELSRSSNASGVISCSMIYKHTQEIPVCYIMKEDEILTTLRELDSISTGRRYTTKLLLPRFYISSYRMGIIFADPCSVIKAVDLTLAKDLIENREVHGHMDLSPVLAGQCVTRAGISLVTAFYLDIVGAKKPIVSMMTRDNVITSIKNRIFMEFLNYERNASMNWKQVLLIRILLAIIIITHSDGMSALSFYSSFQSASLSCGDSRKLILHRGRNIHVGKHIIGFSKGVLGQKIVPVVDELGGFIYVSYRTPEMLKNSIAL